MADVWSITPIGTPILDRCKPLPRNWWAGRGKLTVLDYFIVLGFMAFAGAGTVALLIYFPQAGEQLKKLQSLMPPMGPEESPYLVPLYPLSYFAVGFLVLLVHELGHVIGGISVSY